MPRLTRALPLLLAGLLAVSFSPRASAAAVQRCPVDDVCYQVAVPETSASSGAGNIYVQVRAPSSYTWAALGTGQAMAGANMFVVYADGAGNVTVSPRAGTGHTAPSADGSASRLELLAGSGVLNGTTMVANFRCANCASWSGGSMSLSSDATDWIAAWKVGDPIDSTDVDAPIQYHDAHDGWSFDLTQATVADDANPFVGGAEAEAGAGSDAGNDSGNNSNANSGVSPSSFQDPRPLIFAHGIIMAIVMVVLYPLGSVLMPLFGKWFVHAGFQSTAFLLMWAGFGLGIVSAQRINLNFDSVHTQLGTVVVCLMAVQPALGYVHHRHFVKHQARGIVSHGHIWYGRALMIMGIVNGGLGLALTGASQAFVIVYSVVAGVAFVVYTACATLADFVQELYLKELKAYKPAPVKDSDAVGQVQTFNAPKTPKSPEEADLANSLKEYETMAVEVEGAAPSSSSTPAAVEDWLVEEEEEDAPHH
ncbi:putative iron reductase domain protein [Xylariaceae sp. FL0662B]|nr:putative iron reductase domain protein [Xylariaceae sp. FL0662B]